VTALAPAVGPPASHARVALTREEWSRLDPDDPKDGRLLVGLSFGEDARARALADTLARAGVVTVTELRSGLKIETGSYVGRVAVGPLDVTIVPKVAWARWHVLFGYGLRLRGLVRSDTLDVQVGPTSLQDLLVLELVAEARDLIGRGLHREYVRQRADLASPRGRIDFQRLAVRGGMREAAVPCRFTRRSDDSPLNQVLLAGLQLAAVLASDPGLRADARRLAHELDATVERVSLDAGRLGAVWDAVDRRTARYEPALRLIELLHGGQDLLLEDDEDGGRIAVPGFALDMNRLWQRLLGRVLSEWSPGLDVREEVGLKGLIAHDHAFSPRRRPVPTPRPDFAAFRGASLVAYLDAKYRDLWTNSLPREMLYQLALYAMAQGQGVAAMLYPTEAPDAAEDRLVIRDPIGGETRATVALRPVSLSRLEELITVSPGAARDRARAAFARQLCGVEALM